MQRKNIIVFITVDRVSVYGNFKKCCDIEKLAYHSLKMKNFPIVLNNFEPLVSSDFKKEKFTTIIDHRYTDVINNMIKLLVWYDNEWGYASKVVEILKYYKDIKKG